MSLLHDIEDGVADNPSVVGSVERLIDNIVDAVNESHNARQLDPASTRKSVLNSIVANRTRLGALVEANTPNATTVIPPRVGVEVV